MKTLSDLKRDLKVGARIECITHSIRPKRVGEVSQITKVQTNGILQDNGRFLDIPKASLVEYEGDLFSIYDYGYRDLTDKEKQELDSLIHCTTKEQEELDWNTDSNVCYWTRKKFARDNGIEYLLGHEFVNGKMYNYNDKMMFDKNIKGNLLYTFRMLKEEE